MQCRSLTSRRASRVVLGTLFLLAPMRGAAALPAVGNYLTSLGAGTIGIVADGTSNTIQLTEASQLTVCLDHVTGNVPLAGIADGTSNTLLFGETAALTLQAGRVLPRVPIGSIVDGTSNTIFIGETPSDSLCLADGAIVDPPGDITDGTSNTIQIGEGSQFAVCFRGVRVGTITDGASNTIQFGEVTSSPVCFEDVHVAVAAVSEPALLGAFVVGLAGLFTSASRRRGALTPAATHRRRLSSERTIR